MRLKNWNESAIIPVFWVVLVIAAAIFIVAVVVAGREILSLIIGGAGLAIAFTDFGAPIRDKRLRVVIGIGLILVSALVYFSGVLT